MDNGKVGGLIRKLRLEQGLTQRQLANSLCVSDRTVSKWERGAGCPDISLLGGLAGQLGIPIEELLSGQREPNQADGGNMKRIKFYVCPFCGGVLTGTGEAEVTCCGRKLEPLAAQQPDPAHTAKIQEMDGGYYLTLDHAMTKEHFLTFAACVSYDRVLLVKLYPEQAAELRLPKVYGSQLYLCCSEHGLFRMGNLSQLAE